MSLTSYRAAPPRAGAAVPNMAGGCGDRGWCGCGELRVAGLPGLAATYSSAPIWRSTIGAGGFHGRVRDGIGCLAPRCGHQAGSARWLSDRCLGPGRRVWRLHAGGMVGIGAFERLVPVSLRRLLGFHLRPIDVVVFHGSRRDLVLRGASRLDAFSGYPVRT